MRVTLDIRDDLMQSLLARHPDTPKQRAVERAIEAYLWQHVPPVMRELAGRIRVDDVADGLRRRDRRS